MPSSTSLCKKPHCLAVLDSLLALGPSAPAAKTALEESPSVRALARLYSSAKGRRVVEKLEEMARGRGPQLLYFCPAPPTGLVQRWAKAGPDGSDKTLALELLSALHILGDGAPEPDLAKESDLIQGLVEETNLLTMVIGTLCPRCGPVATTRASGECPTCQSTTFALVRVNLDSQVARALQDHFLLEWFLVWSCRQAGLHVLSVPSPDGRRTSHCSLRFQVSGNFPEPDVVAVTHRQAVLLVAATTRKLTVGTVGEILGKLSSLRDYIESTQRAPYRVHVVVVTSAGIDSSLDPESLVASRVTIMNLECTDDPVAFLSRLAARV